jgi:hypothetical protein
MRVEFIALMAPQILHLICIVGEVDTSINLLLTHPLIPSLVYQQLYNATFLFKVTKYHKLYL